ncbi:hypothetical protein OPV22_007608 [Ensete ventricosum]|uniref:Uncharacterized protein n=1 Tax=Ensete ventricosum TaxID=4639 RepID=A0AAV8QES6_ENSVE|nr:hypothetical protein OPV22_007608 [Ensete ventricosum]
MASTHTSSNLELSNGTRLDIAVYLPVFRVCWSSQRTMLRKEEFIRTSNEEQQQLLSVKTKIHGELPGVSCNRGAQGRSSAFRIGGIGRLRVALRSPPLHSRPAFALEIAGPDLSTRSSRPAPRSTAQARAFQQETKNDLSDYCTTLEGDDDCHGCWRAYFELKDLQEKLPKEDVEKFVRQAGGIKSLISYLHCLTAAMLNEKEKEICPQAMLNQKEKRNSAT